MGGLSLSSTGQPVVFGRSREVETMENSLRDSTSGGILIEGDRGSGKTFSLPSCMVAAAVRSCGCAATGYSDRSTSGHSGCSSISTETQTICSIASFRC